METRYVSLGAKTEFIIRTASILESQDGDSIYHTETLVSTYRFTLRYKPEQRRQVSVALHPTNMPSVSLL
jgi:hypothetical protein